MLLGIVFLVGIMLFGFVLYEFMCRDRPCEPYK